MSSEPLLHESREDSLEMTSPRADQILKNADGRNYEETVSDGAGGPSLGNAGAVPTRKQRISDLFTILCAGCALISDGYANSLMTLINVVLQAQYPKQYVSSVSTRVSNALLVGEICGQITIG